MRYFIIFCVSHFYGTIQALPSTSFSSLSYFILYVPSGSYLASTWENRSFLFSIKYLIHFFVNCLCFSVHLEHSVASASGKFSATNKIKLLSQNNLYKHTTLVDDIQNRLTYKVLDVSIYHNPISH